LALFRLSAVGEVQVAQSLRDVVGLPDEALTDAEAVGHRHLTDAHRNAVQVGQEFEVGQTKGKENRMVPVAASVLSRLAVRCEGRSATDLLFPARTGGYLKRPS
jgi:hypothetical protein